MSADPHVTEAHFRIAFRISQFAHAGTSVAKVSDATLMDHLPRTDAKKLRLFRRAIEASGWVRIVEGERGRPTRYIFLETRIPEIQKRLDAAAAKREAEFALERSRELSATKAAALRARIDAETGKIRGELRGEYDPLIQSSKGGNPCRNKGSILPPLLPKRSTYKTGYRQQDVTQDASAHPHAGAPALTHTVPPQCSTCKNPATVELQLLTHETFSPHCGECREDLIWDAERPIGSSDERQVPVMSYWEASRGL